MWTARVQRTYGTTGRLDKGLHSKDLPAQERETSQQHSCYPEHTPLTEPTNPILPRDPPRDNDVLGPILRDPNIDPGKLGAAISQLPTHLSSRFVPQRSALLSHGPGGV